MKFNSVPVSKIATCTFVRSSLPSWCGTTILTCLRKSSCDYDALVLVVMGGRNRDFSLWADDGDGIWTGKAIVCSESRSPNLIFSDMFRSRVAAFLAWGPVRDRWKNAFVWHDNPCWLRRRGNLGTTCVSPARFPRGGPEMQARQLTAFEETGLKQKI